MDRVVLEGRMRAPRRLSRSASSTEEWDAAARSSASVQRRIDELRAAPRGAPARRLPWTASTTRRASRNACGRSDACCAQCAGAPQQGHARPGRRAVARARARPTRSCAARSTSSSARSTASVGTPEWTAGRLPPPLHRAIGAGGALCAPPTSPGSGPLRDGMNLVAKEFVACQATSAAGSSCSASSPERRPGARRGARGSTRTTRRASASRHHPRPRHAARRAA